MVSINIQDIYFLFNSYRRSLIFCSGFILTGWLFNRFWINRRFNIKQTSLRGKTVLITGGNAGIGYETAKELFRRGARIIIACRNLDKGRQAIENILRNHPEESTQIKLMQLDLSSFESIENFSRIYHENEQRLDILICNAGLGYSNEKLTKDKFDFVIQSNYLGHFLLTNLLLDKLKQSKPSRILNVSSDLHQYVRKIDWSDVLTQRKNKEFMGVYPYSKLFQVLSTVKLKKNLFDDGVDVFCLTPGLVSTSIRDPIEQSVGLLTSILYYPMTFLMKFLFSKTPSAGAQTTIFCACEPALERSKDIYFQNCSPCKTSPLCLDQDSIEKLWSVSLEAIGTHYKQ